MYQFHTERPTPNPYLDIARLVIPNSKIIHKFGANFDIDQSTDPESMWTGGGLYPWSALATAQTIYCISTSESDTGTLIVEGLDENYNEQTESVTLTGTSAVSTSNTFIRVFRMTYGDVANVGTITVRVTSGTGTVVAQIDATYAQTLMAVYTVPAGHTGYLSALDATIDSNKYCQILMYHRLFGNPFRIAHIAESSGHYRYDYHAPLRIPEKTDIDIRVDNVSGNDSRMTANFDILLIRD